MLTFKERPAMERSGILRAWRLTACSVQLLAAFKCCCTCFTGVYTHTHTHTHTHTETQLQISQSISLSTYIQVPTRWN